MLLLAALARPEIGVPLPRREGTVMLAFDVSSSMTATDLTPTRMDAAKAAARTVVERQPPTVRVGVVAFGSSGLVTQQPTADRASVLAAIDRLQPGGGTALGSGLQTSLSAITGQTVLVDAAGSPGSAVEPQGPDLGYHGSAAVVAVLRRREHRRAGPGRRRGAGVERGRAGLPGRDRVARRAP